MDINSAAVGKAITNTNILKTLAELQAECLPSTTHNHMWPGRLA
jgi:hypothetical protein